MLSPEQRTVLRELALYTTFLASALSPWAAPTFCELLLGSMVSSEGFLTRALLANGFHNVWSSYHHWVANGRWRWKDLAKHLIRLVGSKVPSSESVCLLLDDYIIERCSEKAPACRLHHQHSRKKNRPGYLWGQCWVSLAVAFERKIDEVFTAIPILAFPSPATGNASKLKIAVAMLKVVRQELYKRSVQLLTDCWYMNASLMLPAMENGYEIFGQIPKNRALFLLPEEPQKKQRGRKRKYGTKLSADVVESLPEHSATVWMYGRFHDVRYRTCICRARFLKGETVRVVWCQFVKGKGRTKTRLFLCTNPARAGIEILRTYAKRWPTEPMFQQMKHTFGFRHLWQQKLKTLLGWMHIRMAGYALLQLLTICRSEAAKAMTDIPWRNPDTITAGMLYTELARILPRFDIRACWDRNRRKFQFTFEKKMHSERSSERIAA